MSTNLFNPSDHRIYAARWPLYRGKQLFQVIDERSKDGTEELLTVSHITGITPRRQKNVTMFQSESLAGYKICHIGDIAVNTMWTWQGAIGVSSFDGVVSPAYNVYRQKKDTYNPRYLDMLLRERRLIDVYHSLSTGIRPSRLRLYPDIFLTITLPVPPREEQDRIVRFLDWKVSCINRLIQNNKHEISLLEEIRQQLISKTILGLESAGTYELKRLKSVARCNILTLDETTRPDYSFRYVDIGAVDSKKGITKYTNTTFSKAPTRARRVVKTGDIIISTVRTYLRAKTMIEDSDNVIVSTGFAVLTPVNTDSKYLEYCLRSNQFCDEVVRRSIGIAYPAINTSALMNIHIPVVNYDTQRQIANSLAGKCKKIDKNLEIIKRRIRQLENLKNRIVSDIVTGKVNVRGIEIPDYEYVPDSISPEASDEEEPESAED